MHKLKNTITLEDDRWALGPIVCDSPMVSSNFSDLSDGTEQKHTLHICLIS
uniref:Uncharacterized protein n=1 Tax=Arundo donax TaxID=35708 RepID=A0A0A8ZCC4_ARUDO